MRTLSSLECLELWEQGLSLHPLDQGLLMLAAGLPEISCDALAGWPLGRRNQALVEMRCSAFGSRLQGWTTCAHCGENLEFEMDGSTIANVVHRPADGTISVRGHRYRLPASRDLSRAARETDAHQAALRIAESCRIDREPPADLDDAVLNELEQAMASADPLAEILIELRCPACGDPSNETLDIVSFFWTEIEARAKRLLGEVHSLAAVYGWTEPEVLALSDRRRALYLEMVRA